MNPTNELAGRSRIEWNVTLLMFALLAFDFSTPLHGQDEVAPDGSLSKEPYTVYVAQEEAFARCGPSGEFYRTDALRPGQELEVYVETADGWLGVRPPDDSFCWVPASSLELSGSSDQATVTEDHTVAWIGTHLGRARRYRWQVQLAEGEPVTIVGKSERDGPDGPQMWYRIVPPSGEFRWVHRDQVASSPEELVASVAGKKTVDSDIEFLPSPRTERSEEAVEIARVESESTDQEPEVALASSAVEKRPSSRRPTKPRESRSILQQSEHNEVPIGSGVRDDWQANDTRDRSADKLANRQAFPKVPTPAPDIESPATVSPATVSPAIQSPATVSNATPSSMSFVGSPRLSNIGASYDTMTPAVSELASDSNWVGSGTGTGASMNAMPMNNPISQASYTEPAAQPALQQAGSLTDVPNAITQTVHLVDAAAVARVESEANAADAGKLQLMLSRIMAAGAPTEEAEPIAKAAERLARITVDQLEARRAQAIADRTRQYQRVAQRRDGYRVNQSSNPPAIPASNDPFAQTIPPRSGMGTPAIPASTRQGLLSTVPQADSAPSQVEAGDWISETGYLVQVYSARPNSPPFALTDNSGRTLAYVTPVPGTNLRMHLNNYIRVDGQRGFVNGMDTPHVLVNRVQRVAQ